MILRKSSSQRSSKIAATLNMAGQASRHHLQVVHDYHDHANDVDDGEKPSDPVALRAGSTNNVASLFPARLHQMLDQIEADGFADVISWQPHGRAFVIHKRNDFVNKIMPTYFRQSKLSSFQRQLNLYGFQRITKGRDRGGYYHELFLRGRRFLSYRIPRTRVKGTGVRARSNPDQEPNFYVMKPVEALPNDAPAETPSPTTEEVLSSNGDDHHGSNESIAEYEGIPATISSSSSMEDDAPLPWNPESETRLPSDHGKVQSYNVQGVKQDYEKRHSTTSVPELVGDELFFIDSVTLESDHQVIPPPLSQGNDGYRHASRQEQEERHEHGNYYHKRMPPPPPRHRIQTEYYSSEQMNYPAEEYNVVEDDFAYFEGNTFHPIDCAQTDAIFRKDDTDNGSLENYGVSPMGRYGQDQRALF